MPNANLMCHKKLQDRFDARQFNKVWLATLCVLVFGMSCTLFGIVTLFVGPHSLPHSVAEIALGSLMVYLAARERGSYRR